jgi:aspartate aminotransferase, mitochondrial
LDLDGMIHDIKVFAAQDEFWFLTKT